MQNLSAALRASFKRRTVKFSYSFKIMHSACAAQTLFPEAPLWCARITAEYERCKQSLTLSCIGLPFAALREFLQISLTSSDNFSI